MSEPRSEDARPSKGDLTVLRRIAAEDVTWRDDRNGTKSYRLWSTEYDYVTCTPATKRVIARGWAKPDWGYVQGRGGVALTDLGRAVLAASMTVVTGGDAREADRG